MTTHSFIQLGVQFLKRESNENYKKQLNEIRWKAIDNFREMSPNGLTSEEFNVKVWTDAVLSVLKLAQDVEYPETLEVIPAGEY